MNKSRGFTIVELLIVIIVIAILAVISIVAYNGIQNRAKFNKINTELVTMRKFIEMYKAENGTYPPTAGSFRYQRISGDSFIPDIVPTYTNALPQVTATPSGATSNDTYIYASNSTATGYVVMRLFQPSIPSGEWDNVPASMKQTGYTDRYGYGYNLGGF